MDRRDQTRFPSDGIFTPDHKNMRVILNVREVWPVDDEDIESPPAAVLAEGGGLLETVSLPAVYKVCPMCGGRGSYVNPNIDRHGLGTDDPDLDPEFWESYWGGGFDVSCNQCRGERVILMPLDEDNTQDEFKDIVKAVNAELAARAESEYYSRLEEEAERRAGC
jgi:hypothetical protein